jgi:hypothetical protein
MEKRVNLALRLSLSIGPGAEAREGDREINQQVLGIMIRRYTSDFYEPRHTCGDPAEQRPVLLARRRAQYTLDD